MTIHYVCRKQFVDLVNAILVRAEMDESVFDVIERTGMEWKYVRKSIDVAVSKQNVAVQELLRELMACECELYVEEE